MMQDKPSLWQVIKSVLAAMFGVQSDRDRERDFTQGNPWAFIIVGIVLTVIFVFTIYGVVQLVLATAGAGKHH